MTDYDRAVSYYIRSTAGGKKLTQEVVAERANIPVNTLRRYWRGERSVSLGDLRPIIDALGVSTHDALDKIESIFTSGEYRE
jgi:transcriptional regulator with XRE-family HTH domain